MRAQRT